MDYTRHGAGPQTPDSARAPMSQEQNASHGQNQHQVRDPNQHHINNYNNNSTNLYRSNQPINQYPQPPYAAGRNQNQGMPYVPQQGHRVVSVAPAIVKSALLTSRSNSELRQIAQIAVMPFQPM
ncbi:hypothetical protein J1614_007201 [Plenodomus biglobosus]|nr:hypothetical protein J1614_007201 [Plenodomus biglobosus]